MEQDDFRRGALSDRMFRWLCYLGIHNFNFCWREYAHEGQEYRQVYTVCTRCGLNNGPSEMVYLDNEGNEG